jgi:hypothetical protein
MTQSNFLELAKKGDPKVIAGLLSRNLQNKGILAKATQHNGELYLRFDCQTIPDRQIFLPYLEEALARLKIPPTSISVSVCHTGEDEAVWQSRFAFQGVNGPNLSSTEYTDLNSPPVSPGLEPLAPETTNPELTPDPSSEEVASDPVLKVTADAIVTETPSQGLEGLTAEPGIETSGEDRFSSGDATRSPALDPYDLEPPEEFLNSKTASPEDSDHFEAHRNGNTGVDLELEGASSEESSIPVTESEPALPQELSIPEAAATPPTEKKQTEETAAFPLWPFIVAATGAIICALVSAFNYYFLRSEPPSLGNPSSTTSTQTSPAPTSQAETTPAPATSSPPETSAPPQTSPPSGTASLPDSSLPTPTDLPSSTTQPVSSSTDPWRNAVNQAMQASTLAQSAQTPEDWQAVVTYWEEAIKLMELVSPDSPNYLTAQDKVQEYTPNLEYARNNAGL